MARVLDLNADLGEGFGRWTLTDDEALLAVVTSANVACGFHAGDPSTMRRVCAAAVTAGVAIGAQVGYRDLAGFGRRDIAYRADELAADVLYQLAALDGIARSHGGRVTYLKPHGALYHRTAVDPAQAGAVVEAVGVYDPSLPVLTLSGSVLAELARAAGLTVVEEVFADRGYLADGRLTSRGEPGAVVTDPAAVAARVVRLAADGVIDAVDGTLLPVSARSVCVHGDSPSAVEVARAVRAALEAEGVTVAAFT
ncbi:MAG TPA: 5-oxoprolinase subunit PxpA [Cryptosporangiaceae bacterium]|nr:5-oxoprolinase subunit PxpA [Cryptosporangiaceae bacterium]